MLVLVPAPGLPDPSFNALICHRHAIASVSQLAPHTLEKPCFSLYWASISPVYCSDLLVWAEKVLPLCRDPELQPLSLTERLLRLCFPPGSRWPDTPDNQVISLAVG